MPHKVRFIKVQNNHNALRDDTIEGDCKKLPKVGEQFVLVGEPRDNKNATCRLVTTNTVTDVKRDKETGNYMFKTASGSEYKIERLGPYGYIRSNPEFTTRSY